ncbi:MAG: hypothetical protein RMY34_08135 [Aulosira sp. DedQUE10]|nr:hypothetical protein [Aulosira sp. DedQUE10]
MSTLSFDELVRKFNDLRQLCYQNLALRITKIEDYLSTLTERVIDGTVIVNGAFNSEKISPVNISETQLVQVYNDVPQILFKNSLIVELTAKSYYRDVQDNEPILLENDENGKYWMITTDIDKFFLVPSINIKLHIHKLTTVEKLFDFYGISPSVDSHFILVKPAKVSSQASGKTWKLEEKGILEFKNYLLQLPLELETNILEFPDLQLNVADSNLEIQKLARQLEDLKLQINQYQQERKELESQINKIPVLRDFVYLQIELLKVRLDSLEDRNNR